MINDKYLRDNFIYFADVGAMGGPKPKWEKEQIFIFLYYLNLIQTLINNY